MKCLLFITLYLVLISPKTANTFDEIEAKKECDKWVHGGGSYLMWAKV